MAKKKRNFTKQNKPNKLGESIILKIWPITLELGDKNLMYTIQDSVENLTFRSSSLNQSDCCFSFMHFCPLLSVAPVVSSLTDMARYSSLVLLIMLLLNEH